ncbi:2,5-diamino-6-(ribosylamino)-4(3H)-pyrimidinone 5'-phosphate reductase [Haplosporangium sp. Z 27]|nr:2,5-diamino-6-(ribosylamino)-4(3H)-pyrimidinone 5'-phosphate reductase [Haplosporangium sp. Z 27]
MTNIPADYRFLFNQSFVNAKIADSPHVTLTFAQSLDGKIAGSQGKQLILSGPESMKATHMQPEIKTRRDPIRLNSEDLPLGSASIEHPQPIILDAMLRFPKTSKLLLPTSPKKPWIFTSPSHDGQKKQGLEELGAKVFIIDNDSQGLLSKLFQESIRSLMVEGGAGVISSFLKSGLVDSFLLTIAPVYIGKDGIDAVQDAESAAKFENISYHTLGRDIMMVAKQA